MENLADKVQLAKDGYENAMLYIIDLFEPLIGTYTALLNYDNKDSRSYQAISSINIRDTG